MTCVASTSLFVLTIYHVFPYLIIYLVFLICHLPYHIPPPIFMIALCRDNFKRHLVLTLKVFLVFHIFDKSAFLQCQFRIRCSMYAETVISALFLNARKFLTHFKISLLPPKPAQTCLTNRLLAPHTTIQVRLYTTPHHSLFHCTHGNHHCPSPSIQSHLS